MRARLIRWIAIAMLPMIVRAVQRRMSGGGKDQNTFEHRGGGDDLGRSDDQF